MMEYRLVVARPDHEEGRPTFNFNKRDEAHALKGLSDHERERPTWAAWIETRNVTQWTQV